MSDASVSAMFSNALSNAQAASADNMDKKKAAIKDPSKVAEDFEAMFVSQMITPMFAGLEADGEFDGGSAEQSYRGMLINEYGKSIARAGGIGLAAPVKAELIRMQGAQA
jgi:Rod binding domain-containing protein